MSIVARALAVLLIAAGAALALPFRPAAAATVNIQVSGTFGQTWFCNSSYQGGVCPTTINVGDTVHWAFNGDSISSQHTTTYCGADCNIPTATPLWDSGPIQVGNFSFMFTTPGVYLYQCTIHTSLMRGQITVLAGGVGGETQLVDGVSGALKAPAGSSGHLGLWLWLAAIAAGAVTLAGASLLTRRALAAPKPQS